MKTPFRVRSLNYFSGLWLAFSFYWWLIKYNDISQFIFAVGLGLFLLYVAHNEKSKLELKTTQEEIIKDKIEGLWKECDEINKAMDSMNNSLQDKLGEKK